MLRTFAVLLLVTLAGQHVLATDLEAGAARVEITPPTGFPMWGYSSRKDRPSTGVLDPLQARALVLKVGKDKIAIVSLDLGRAPTRASMQTIRDALKPDEFKELFLVASHTHHGPILELDTWPDAEKPYTRQLEEKIVSLIRKADTARVPARYGAASAETKLNRNRQSRLPDSPVDNELLVLRLEDLKGKPIAHAVNFAAHPTLLPAELMKFSADFPGVMASRIEAETGVPCLFLQGAAGDLSPHLPEGIKDPDGFGKRLAAEVTKLIGTIEVGPLRSKEPTLAAAREEMKFRCVVDVTNHQIKYALGKAFFPALIGFFEQEYRDGVRPLATVAILDDRIGFVGFSGEMFCEHALTLKRRARLPHLFVLGYCNDYQQYFPTIQAVAERGYGTVPPMSVAEIGAGEQLTNRALIRLYQLRDKLPE
jgi:hypothetical protein